MIWFALLAGPAAWAVRQLVSYALVTPSCANGHTAPLVVTAAAMLGMTLAGAVTGGLCAVRSRGGRDDGPAPIDRARFMATMAVWLNLLVALLILLSSVAEFVLSPCE